jgi:periplasmic protein TonB
VRFVSRLAVLAMLLSGSGAVAQTAAAPSSDQAAWTRKVQQHLLDQVNKAKPATRAVFLKAKSAGMRGDVRVSIGFMVARNGRIETTKVEKSSGNAEIDGIAQDLIARSGPVPAIPAAVPEETQSFILPVVFREMTAAKSKAK